MAGCGAPAQSISLPVGIDVAKETIIAGTVSNSGAPVGGAYVRLLDVRDEFTAEVVTSPEGHFRFFAAPGTWTLSIMHRDGRIRQQVRAPDTGIYETLLTLA